MRPCRVLRIIHNLDHAATGGPGNWRSRRYERSDWRSQKAIARVATHPHRDRARDGASESPILGSNRFNTKKATQRNEQWHCQLYQRKHTDHHLTWRLHLVFRQLGESLFAGAAPHRHHGCSSTARTAARLQLNRSGFALISWKTSSPPVVCPSRPVPFHNSLLSCSPGGPRPDIPGRFNQHHGGARPRTVHRSRGTPYSPMVCKRQGN